MSPPYARNLHSTDRMQKNKKCTTSEAWLWPPACTQICKPIFILVTPPWVSQANTFRLQKRSLEVLHVSYVPSCLSTYTLFFCWHFTRTHSCTLWQSSQALTFRRENMCMHDFRFSTVCLYYSLPLSISVNALQVSENWWWQPLLYQEVAATARLLITIYYCLLPFVLFLLLHSHILLFILFVDGAPIACALVLSCFLLFYCLTHNVCRIKHIGW